jgi:hypothetical protein
MLLDTIRAFRAKLDGRSLAYHRVFDRKSPYTQEVLKDLARFCRAHESTFHADPRLHAVLEGRREVWLLIERMLNLSTEELYLLHKVKDERQVNQSISQANQASPL